MAVPPSAFDLIIKFFKAALGAGQGDDVGAFLCQRQGDGTAKPARGAGDDGHAVFKLLWPWVQPASARSDSCCLARFADDVGEVGGIIAGEAMIGELRAVRCRGRQSRPTGRRLRPRGRPAR